MSALMEVIKSFIRVPKEQKIYGVFFLIFSAGTAYLSNAIVNFSHLTLVYGLKKVFLNDLHFMYKRMTITVSNGDQLSSMHSICNFIAVCIIWISILGLTHCVAFKILKRTAPDFFDKFFKKINIP